MPTSKNSLKSPFSRKWPNFFRSFSCTVKPVCPQLTWLIGLGCDVTCIRPGTVHVWTQHIGLFATLTTIGRHPNTCIYVRPLLVFPIREIRALKSSDSASVPASRSSNWRLLFSLLFFRKNILSSKLIKVVVHATAFPFLTLLAARSMQCQEGFGFTLTATAGHR